MHEAKTVNTTTAEAFAFLSAQIEQLAVGAVKEQAIETKLAGIGAEWAVASLTFADYKTRGPVILKVDAVLRYSCISASGYNASVLCQKCTADIVTCGDDCRATDCCSEPTASRLLSTHWISISPARGMFLSLRSRLRRPS